MTIKFANNASAVLAGSINTTATTIVVNSGTGAVYPALDAGDYFYATLIDAANNLEIVKVTARSGDTLTVVRGQEDTTARSFAAGSKLEARPTAAGLMAISVENVPAASTSVAGVVQLNDTTSSTSTTQAATARALKVAYDLAVAALPKAGGTVTGEVLFNTAPVFNASPALNASPIFANAIPLSFRNSEGVSNGTTKGAQIFKFSDGHFYFDNYDSKNFVWRGDSGAVLGTLTNAGDLTATGNVTAYSDERLKTNWLPLAEDFVEMLAMVKSGTYERIDNHAVQAGVSAQSLRMVMPEVVQMDEHGILSVAYGNAALVACVELAKRVVTLEAELKSLKR